MHPIRIAVVGTGFGQRTIIPCLMKHDDFKVVALCGGEDMVKARSIASHFSIPIWQLSYKEMIAQSEIELVFIASPPAFHFNMVELALDHGLHIICEKPLALSIEDIGHLLTRVAKSQKLHIINHQLPFFPPFVEVRRIIEQRKIGKPYFVKIAYQTDRLVLPGMTWRWWFDEHAGGGMVYAMASHFLKLLQYWFGESIHLIHAYTSPVLGEIHIKDREKNPLRADSLFHVQLQMENGIISDLFCTGVSYRQTQLEIGIYGTIGEIHYSSLDNKTLLYMFDHSGKRIEQQFGQFPSKEDTLTKESLFTIGFEYFVRELPYLLDDCQRAKDDSRVTTFDSFDSQFRIVDAIRHSLM